MPIPHPRKAFLPLTGFFLFLALLQFGFDKAFLPGRTGGGLGIYTRQDGVIFYAVLVAQVFVPIFLTLVLPKITGFLKDKFGMDFGDDTEGFVSPRERVRNATNAQHED